MNTSEPSKENPSVPNSAKFTGTDNPRQLRAIAALMAGPVPRETLDRVAGASNGPAVIAALRESGLEVPCDRVHVLDRDGRESRPGIYRMTEADRLAVRQWQTRRRGRA